MEITCEQGEKFINALKNEGAEMVKSLLPFCSNFTLNIICGKFLVIKRFEEKFQLYNIGDRILWPSVISYKHFVRVVHEIWNF